MYNDESVFSITEAILYKEWSCIITRDQQAWITCLQLYLSVTSGLISPPQPIYTQWQCSKRSSLALHLGIRVRGKQAGTVRSRHTPGRLLTLNPLATPLQGPWRCTGGEYSGDQRPAHPVFEGGSTPQLVVGAWSAASGLPSRRVGWGADWGAARASTWPSLILQGSSNIPPHLVHRHFDQDWRNLPRSVIGVSPGISRMLCPESQTCSPTLSINPPYLALPPLRSHRLSCALSQAHPFCQDTCGSSRNAPRLSSLLRAVLVPPCSPCAETWPS